MDRLQQVTIVGTGLLGTSLGLALKTRNLAERVVGVGRQVATVERARDLGAVDDVATDVAAAAAPSDLVVLATPLGQFPAVFAALASCDRPDLTVTDVGSTKADVCRLARTHLKRPQRFIGSHPMAGSERQGPDAGSADLFNGKPCILTPEADADPAALTLVRDLWLTLGMRVLVMAAPHHDAQVARISHLPHLLAVLLVDLAARHGSLDVASTGFADTTRIASGDPHIWADVFTSNRDAVLTAIDAFTADLAQARHLIAQGDPAQLLHWLTQSKTTRDNWQSGTNTPED